MYFKYDKTIFILMVVILLLFSCAVVFANEGTGSITHVVLEINEDMVIFTIGAYGSALAAGPGDATYDYMAAGGVPLVRAVRSGDKFIGIGAYGTAFAQEGNTAGAIASAPAQDQETISGYLVFEGFDESGDPILTPLFAGEFAGGDGTAADPWQIATPQQLDNVRNYLGVSHVDKYFVLVDNLDLGVSPWNDGAGWEPIGTSENSFRGTFDGAGYTISNLYIDRENTNHVGLFGYISTAEISDINLAAAEVKGENSVGILVGFSFQSSISETHVTGSVTGVDSVGGLAGGSSSTGAIISSSTAAGNVSGNLFVGGLAGENMFSSVIDQCHATSTVAADALAGGLVGRNVQDSTITGSYSTGSVAGNSAIGGLVGINTGSTIANSYASGAVTGVGNSYELGGLVGKNYSIITDSYAVGSVTGNNYLGGLVGYNEGQIDESYARGDVTGNFPGGLVGWNVGEVYNVYATGAVTGGDYAGGLVGSNAAAGIIVYAYAVGNVTGDIYPGGLAGINQGTITASYYDKAESGQGDTGVGSGDSSGVTGLITEQMKDYQSFQGWDFVNTWGINPASNGGYPFLRWQGYVHDPFVTAVHTKDPGGRAIGSNHAKDPGNMTITAKNIGASGNNIAVELWTTGPFSGETMVTEVSGGTIHVKVKSLDKSFDSVSTAAEIKAAIEGHKEANALVSVAVNTPGIVNTQTIEFQGGADIVLLVDWNVEVSLEGSYGNLRLNDVAATDVRENPSLSYRIDIFWDNVTLDPVSLDDLLLITAGTVKNGVNVGNTLETWRYDGTAWTDLM